MVVPPLLIMVAGNSGVGKSTMCKYVCDLFTELNFIRSYTNRPLRDDLDRWTHIQLSDDEMDEVWDSDDVIARTIYGGYRYVTTSSMLSKYNIGIFDEESIKSMKDNYYPKDYRMYAIKIVRDVDDIDIKRVIRDKGKYKLSDEYFDYIIYNNMSLYLFYEKAKLAVDDIFKMYRRGLE